MKVREIRTEDYDFFAKHARQADIDECLAVSKMPLRDHIRVGVELSLESYCLVDNEDRPLALYGVIKDKECHYTWLLTTEFIEEHKLSFMKQVRKNVKIWYNKYGRLCVLTDLRYTRAVKLNEWAGFYQVGDAININGVDFGCFCYSGE